MSCFVSGKINAQYRLIRFIISLLCVAESPDQNVQGTSGPQVNVTSQNKTFTVKGNYFHWEIFWIFKAHISSHKNSLKWKVKPSVFFYLLYSIYQSSCCDVTKGSNAQSSGHAKGKLKVRRVVNNRFSGTNTCGKWFSHDTFSSVTPSVLWLKVEARRR